MEILSRCEVGTQGTMAAFRGFSHSVFLRERAKTATKRTRWCPSRDRCPPTKLHQPAFLLSISPNNGGPQPSILNGAPAVTCSLMRLLSPSMRFKPASDCCAATRRSRSLEIVKPCTKATRVPRALGVEPDKLFYRGAYGTAHDGTMSCLRLWRCLYYQVNYPQFATDASAEISHADATTTLCSSTTHRQGRCCSASRQVPLSPLFVRAFRRSRSAPPVLSESPPAQSSIPRFPFG